MGVTGKSENNLLRLVASDAPETPLLDSSSWPVDLERSPYRPGELPESLRVELDRRSAGRARRRAAADGVPVSLWVRAAVEAGRARDLLADSTRCTSEEIDALLLEAAICTEAPRGISALERYAAAVISGLTPGGSASGPSLEVLLPSEMLLAWRLAAGGSALSMEAWVAAMISRAPAGVTRLEARAAAEGESLAAWCYAAFLACPASRSASAHPWT
jgi:hypothetical protein